jgi:hypothetical protein
MYSKVFSKSAISALGIVFVISICIGLSGNIALADEHIPDFCDNNSEFTTDFRLEDCKFKDKGKNPYFNLEPGFQVVLETPEDEGEDEGEDEDEDERERVVITVLHDKKTITLPRDGKKDRKIKTRVVEERESEWDDEEEEWVTKEISRNYFAICKLTNAVYYFGELSQECDDGFTEDEQNCEGDDGPTPPDTEGSWEAGVDGAMPGLIMPGTILLGAKYFQEQAEEAMDRGQIEKMGLEWPVDEDEDADADEDDFEFTDCIEIIDTNPTEADECDAGSDDADIKIYCPGVGLVQDEELLLVGYGKGDEWEGEQEGDN